MENSFFDISKFALMQGRLVDSEKKDAIQFFPHKNWKKELIFFKENNINFIEWTVSLDNIKKNPICYKNSLNVIKTITKKNRVNIRSIDAQFFTEKPFHKGSPKDQKKGFRNLTKILVQSQLLEIKFFIIPALESGNIEDQKQEKLFINGIRKLSKYLNKKSLILIESDLNLKDLHLILNKIKRKNVGINYDIGNSAGNGHNFQCEKKYFSKVFNIHIKDKKFKGETTSLGRGDADFKKIFSYLKTINYEGYFAFQCARSKINDHVGEIKKNIKFIKQFI
jgi:sugar phosphate isomerase/epimerase